MNTSNTTIQLRVDKKTKQQAKKTLDEIGLDFSSAIKLFLKNVIITESIPFEIRTKNGFTHAQERQIIRDAEDTLKNAKRYNSSQELHKNLIS